MMVACTRLISFMLLFSLAFILAEHFHSDLIYHIHDAGVLPSPRRRPWREVSGSFMDAADTTLSQLISSIVFQTCRFCCVHTCHLKALSTS